MATPAVLSGGTDASWSQLAACRGADVDLFFSVASVEMAKACCAQCPVRQPCLEFAIASEPRDSKEDLGVYGGMTYDERRSLRRRKWRYGDNA